MYSVSTQLGQLLTVKYMIILENNHTQQPTFVGGVLCL